MNKIINYIMNNSGTFIGKSIVFFAILNIGICAYKPNIFEDSGFVAMFNIFLLFVGGILWSIER